MTDYHEPTIDDIARALGECRWIFAKTMPENPHHYTLRKEWSDPTVSFDQAVMFIRHHGFREKYAKSWYTVMHVDGFKFWTMGAPLAITILINRKGLGVD